MGVLRPAIGRIEGATDFFSKLIYEQPPDMFRRSLSSACLGGRKSRYQERALQIYSQYLYLSRMTTTGPWSTSGWGIY